jgi:hypothetical protein
MKHACVVAAGMLLGLAVAGAAAPALVMMLPPRLRGAAALWSLAVVLVGLGAYAAWLLVRRSKSDDAR